MTRSRAVADGVQVITPNPKTSGGARWYYLAAWAYADRACDGDEAAIRRVVERHDAARNREDWKALGQLFTEDAEWFDWSASMLEIGTDAGPVVGVLTVELLASAVYAQSYEGGTIFTITLQQAPALPARAAETAA